jgi:aminoglycoside phosphotransferase (APT) family kinase protein
MLEQSDIAHYLLSLGLVKPRDVVEGELAVADASRRNVVFIATTRAGPAHVVKQPRDGDAGALLHEAAVLRALAAVPGVAEQVPELVHHEPRTGLLVMRTPAGGRDWSEHHGAGRFPRTTARALGRALAALHGLPADHAPDPGVDRLWGLSLAEPPYERVLELSGGAQDVVARLQASAPFRERLAALRPGDGDRAFTHGDVRWDNCMAVAAPGARRRTRLLLVDWELAGPGEPGFDVAAVLADYLRVWVGSIPIVDPLDPGRLAARARHPLAAMRPAMQAFWDAYRAACRAPPSLPRVVELVAVRLLHVAVERAQGLHAASAHVVVLLQLADNLLADPEDAAAGLLGLRT